MSPFIRNQAEADKERARLWNRERTVIRPMLDLLDESGRDDLRSHLDPCSVPECRVYLTPNDLELETCHGRVCVACALERGMVRCPGCGMWTLADIECCDAETIAAEKVRRIATRLGAEGV